MMAHGRSGTQPIGAYAAGMTKRPTDTTLPVLGVLGAGLVPADDPVLAADDLGLTRGDGCFEATRVVTSESGSHEVDHLDAHLDRLAVSCALLALPEPDRERWLELIGQVLTEWHRPGEAMLKLMLTRGRESSPGGPITGIASVTATSEKVLRQRQRGIGVATLARGTASNTYTDAPWLLGGVKTLSYAVNVAALRTATERGADDVLFTSTDGFVLEAPTASVVWLTGSTLHTTPHGGTGILASITQQALFTEAESDGFTTDYALGTVTDLHAADGVWLVSSGRGVARIHTLDGSPLRDCAEATERLSKLAGF